MNRIWANRIRKQGMLAVVLALICLHADSQVVKHILAAGGRHDTAGITATEQGFRFEAELSRITLLEPEDVDGFLRFAIPGYQEAGLPGYPALPARSFLFEGRRALHNEPEILLLDSIVIDLTGTGIEKRIVPAIPPVRVGEPAEQPSPDSLAYGRDVWLGGPVCRITHEGIMRGVSLSALRFNPVRYNPVRNQLKVYYRMICRWSGSEDEDEGACHTGAFEQLLKRVARKRTRHGKKALQAEQPLTLVVLSDTLFRHALQPLVRWKTRKGFHVIEAYRQESAVGSSRESIKQYLSNLYHNPPEGVAPPSFLIIAGDVEHIPLSQSSGQITDLYYAEFDGEGDYIPDLFYGRISVADTAQLNAVVSKILEYEQCGFSDPSFLSESVLIAGVDGAFASTHGNGQIRYARDNYLNGSFGRTAHYFPYPRSDTSDAAILDLISGGVGFVNYTGHGLYDRWINPTFHLSDIGSLENAGRYPVMIGNGCETNVFSLSECFAEALLRAPGKGALAYIGCTNDSYWDEDFYWAVGVGPITASPLWEETTEGYYDRVFHTHGEPYELWAPTLGEMVFGGNMSVQQSLSSRKKFYWEIYQLAGDPTLIPWFSVPENQSVRHPHLVPEGTSRLDVTCSPYAYAALSREGKLLDARHASGTGYVTLQIPGSATAGTLDLVVSGPGVMPYEGEILVGAAGGPYLDILEYSLADETVESDGAISRDEQFSLDLMLVNRGSLPLNGDTLFLHSDREEVVVTDSLAGIDHLPPGDTVLLEDVFRIASGGAVPDQTAVHFGIARRGDTLHRKMFLREKVHAPVLVSGGIEWDDRPSGNGNGIAETGERLDCRWLLMNRGHFRTGGIDASGAATVAFTEVHPGSLSPLMPGDSAWLRFSVRMGTGSGLLRAGPFEATETFLTVCDSFAVVPGRHFEDFTRKSQVYPFTNQSASPWRVDSQNFVSSASSMRSGPVENSGRSELSIPLTSLRPDTLAFSYRVSSEAGYDFLRFYVDSSLVERWSGERAWDRYFHPLDSGAHTITWSYTKDQSVTRGEDAGWLDDIAFPATAFRSADLSLLEIAEPESGPWLESGEKVLLRVRNTGFDTVSGFHIELYLDGRLLASDTVGRILAPGRETLHTLSAEADLSAFARYEVSGVIGTPGDVYTGNNRLDKKVTHTLFPDLSLSLSHIDSMPGLYSDAILLLENTGNLKLDTFAYLVEVDGAVRDTGTRVIGLEPGETGLETFRVADTAFTPGVAGYHLFAIKSTLTDSVSHNNEVTGQFFWRTTGDDRSRSAPAIRVYPNPSSRGFRLELNRPAESDLVVEMVDPGGRILSRQMLEKGSGCLHIPAAGRSGTYLLRIPEWGIAIPAVEE